MFRGLEWLSRLGGGQATAPTPTAAVAPPEHVVRAPLTAQPGGGVPSRAAAGVEAGLDAEAATAGAAACGASSPRRSPRLAPRPLGLLMEGLDAVQEEDEADKAPRRVAKLRPLKLLRMGEDEHLAKRLREMEVPTGPWPTDEEAKVEINAWALNRELAGGGFAVTWGSHKPAVTSGSARDRGRLHTLICHNRRGGDGPPCTWSLTLEECQEGWAIRSYHPHDGEESGHNHPLAQTAVEAKARSSMRDIPRDLVDIGKALIKAGVEPSRVFTFLKQQAEKDGAEALFTYQDVYHACGASTGERRLDATNLVEMLSKREMEEGLFQRITTDESGCLKEVFFAMKGATEVYANAPEKQLVEIDHKVRSPLASVAQRTDRDGAVC